MKGVMISLLTISVVFTLLNSCSSKTFSIDREQDAIRAVIKKETEAYYKQDFATWKSTYVNTPYFRSYGYWEGYPDKVKYFNGFDTLRNFKKKQFEDDRTLWKGSIEEQSNENFRIYKDVAWYTYDQVSYDSARNKVYGRSVETRILEKHDGEWKIAYLGFHYLPQ